MVKLVIQLGTGWRQFTPPRDDVQLLGTVSQGPAIGALALHADGRFVQLNGDMERPLNGSRIRNLLGRRQRQLDADTARRDAQAARAAAASQVKVIVKRRRKLDPTA